MQILYVVINGLAVLVFLLAVWHGWSFQIGKPGTGFEMKVEQYPLKRFFNDAD